MIWYLNHDLIVNITNNIIDVKNAKMISFAKLMDARIDQRTE